MKVRIFYPELYYAIYEYEASSYKEAIEMFRDGKDCDIHVGDHICGASEIMDYHLRDGRYEPKVDTGRATLSSFDSFDKYPPREEVADYVKDAVISVLEENEPAVLYLDSDHNLFLCSQEEYSNVDAEIESYYVFPPNLNIENLNEKVYKVIVGDE